MALSWDLNSFCKNLLFLKYLVSIIRHGSIIISLYANSEPNNRIRSKGPQVWDACPLSTIDISKNNTLRSVRPVRLTHLTPERKSRIRTQRRIDVASWLCVTWRRPSWRNQDTDPYVLCVLTASGAALLRPGDAWSKGLPPWRRLI